MNSTSDLLHAISRRIDEGNAHRDPEARTWGRLAKCAEETGEVIDAYIGMTGQNPRKGVTNGQADVEEELLDVVVTALGALCHMAGNNPAVDVLEMLHHKTHLVAERLLGGHNPNCSPYCSGDHPPAETLFDTVSPRDRGDTV